MGADEDWVWVGNQSGPRSGMEEEYKQKGCKGAICWRWSGKGPGFVGLERGALRFPEMYIEAAKQEVRWLGETVSIMSLILPR